MEFNGMKFRSPLRSIMPNANNCPSHTGDKINRQGKNSGPNYTLRDIFNEYDLKRNQHFPNEKSPNLFMTKLNLRLKIYYNNCINMTNLNK